MNAPTSFPHNSVPSGCDRFEWLLSALLEDEPEARAHLAECAACRDEYAAVRNLFGEIAVALPLNTAPDLRPAVLARIGALSYGEAHGKAPANGLRRQGRFYLAAVAALLLIAVMTPLTWRLSTAASGPLPAISANADTFSDELLAGIEIHETEENDLTFDLLNGLQSSTQDLPAF